MANPAFSAGMRTALVLICLFFMGAWSEPSRSAQSALQNSFTDQVAAQLIGQIAGGLLDHNPKKMLSAFDLARMPAGPLFRQQINSFFAQTGRINVHFFLVSAGQEEDKGQVSVNVELEAGLRDDSLTPVRKRAQLQLVAENTAQGWKFTGLHPQSFFSLEP